MTIEKSEWELALDLKIEETVGRERWDSMSAMQRNFFVDRYVPREPSPPPPWQPEWFFFYGTLMIPEILQRILNLEERPQLYKASIFCHEVKIWGPYPALIKRANDAPFAQEWGMAYLVEKQEHIKRLIEYEGENYKIDNMMPIKRWEPIEEAVRGSAFVWRGYPEELQEGSFDPSKFSANDSVDEHANYDNGDNDATINDSREGLDTPDPAITESIEHNPWAEEGGGSSSSVAK